MDRRRPLTRTLLLALLTILTFGAVLGRLAQLQLFEYREFLARAHRQQQRMVEVSPRRGVVYDRNLHELAMSIPEDSCFAIPAEIADAGMVARLLAGILEADPEDIETRLTSSRSFAWVARKVPAEKVERIQALNLRGIYFQRESQRFYPKGELAAHVLGYVDIDDRGLGGVEYQFDDRLKGKPVQMLVLADARRRWYERRGPAERDDVAGSLVLTIDENIQYIAEKALAAAVARTKAKAGVVLVQDPNTGDLLAVANWPTFDPNSPGAAAPEARMNRAVSALYEPGSTFKVVTVAGALQEGLARPDELVDCQMGAISIANHRIRDHKPFGMLTVSQIISNSSDVGAIKLGLRLGAPKFYDYIRAFGFGASTGIELPGETRGLLRRVENWSAISIGAVSMGQEVGVTPVQMVSAFSAIANGGLLYRPHVVREVRGGGQGIPAAADPPRRAIQAETAATMRQMLEGVVLEGTGKLARLDSYTSAGKTGTAQKIDPATGRYSARDYIASFIGFAPVNSPAVTVLVALDSPSDGHHGGSVAAPVFREVTQQTLAYLRASPDVPVGVRIPQASRETGGDAGESDLSDFDPAQILDPDAQRSDEPAPVTRSPITPSPGGTPAHVSVPVLSRASLSGAQGGWPISSRSDSPRAVHEAPVPSDPEAETTVVLDEAAGVGVPNFTGKPVRWVIEECMRLGLSPVPVGAGIAVEQAPAAGARVRPGSRIVVRFAASGALRAISQKGN
jgi:cell division protein FtsI (penicillin-binding protein 3)